MKIVAEHLRIFGIYSIVPERTNKTRTGDEPNT